MRPNELGVLFPPKLKRAALVVQHDRDPRWHVHSRAWLGGRKRRAVVPEGKALPERVEVAAVPGSSHGLLGDQCLHVEHMDVGARRVLC
eukprot:scaffold49995_cov32-Tisochrysis_lutea.AAC.1